MFYHKCIDLVDLVCGKAITSLQPNGIQPKLGLAVVATNMNVKRLGSITGVTEKR